MRHGNPKSLDIYVEAHIMHMFFKKEYIMLRAKNTRTLLARSEEKWIYGSSKL